jgi:hypothetical protein
LSERNEPTIFFYSIKIVAYAWNFLQSPGYGPAMLFIAQAQIPNRAIWRNIESKNAQGIFYTFRQLYLESVFGHVNAYKQTEKKQHVCVQISQCRAADCAARAGNCRAAFCAQTRPTAVLRRRLALRMCRERKKDA